MCCRLRLTRLIERRQALDHDKPLEPTQRPLLLRLLLPYRSTRVLHQELADEAMNP